MDIKTLDEKIIDWLRRRYLLIARLAIFVIYFYFGFLKLLGESPASPLAQELLDKTVASANADVMIAVLAVFECLIGLMFLVPRLTRLAIPLILIHIVIVSTPLVLLPGLVFEKPFVPTLEGQYIIKNIAIVALALGVAAQTKPLKK